MRNCCLHCFECRSKIRNNVSLLNNRVDTGDLSFVFGDSSVSNVKSCRNFSFVILFMEYLWVEIHVLLIVLQFLHFLKKFQVYNDTFAIKR